MTASRRPGYTRQVLEALLRCDGVEDYRLLPCLEPGDDRVRELLESVTFMPCEPTVHESRLGCGANTLFALERGFANSDFVIHLEDDTLPAADALRFFEHCRDAYRDDPAVFTIGGYPSKPNAPKVAPNSLDGRFRTIQRHQWFTPWGWATWRNRFEEMRQNWDSESWDTHLNNVVRGDRFEITPVLSRFQNIGAEEGAHVPSPQWHRENQHLDFWAGVAVVLESAVWYESPPIAGAGSRPSAALVPHARKRRQRSGRSFGGRQRLSCRPFFRPRYRHLAGGVKYLTCAWVLIRLLRHLGCEHPIEVWYLGEAEKDSYWIELVAPYGVACIDAHDVRDRHPHPNLGGWQSKAYAILHSRFREVLFLDADNVPTVDPTYLFETPEYRDTGAIFWPDTPSMNAEHPAWDLFGVPYRDEREQESGQLLIDKRRCWEALNLCNWYNERSDFFYRFIYGDKDTFRFAWHRAARRFSMPAAIGGPRFTIGQGDFQGRLLFQHRCGDKWSLAGNRASPGFEHEDRCIDFVRELAAALEPDGASAPHPAGERPRTDGARGRASRLPIRPGRAPQLAGPALGRRSAHRRGPIRALLVVPRRPYRAFPIGRPRLRGADARVGRFVARWNRGLARGLRPAGEDENIAAAGAEHGGRQTINSSDGLRNESMNP